MPLGSSRTGLLRSHAGGDGTAFDRNIQITPTITSYDDASYGTGYKNKIVYTITSNLPNATIDYALNNASNSWFANGAVSGAITLDSSGSGSLSYDMNVWSSYSATSTNINLSLKSQPTAEILKTSSNVTFAPADAFTATSANASVVNHHAVHVFDSYQTTGTARVWDDMVVTNIGDGESPYNDVTAIIVGAGGAGGSATGGGGGEVIYYKAKNTTYNTGNIAITLGGAGKPIPPPTFYSSNSTLVLGDGGVESGGNVTYPATYTGNIPKGGNTTFGFHETTSTVTAYGGAGGSSYGLDDASGSIANRLTGNSTIGLFSFRWKSGTDRWNLTENFDFGGSGAGAVPGYPYAKVRPDQETGPSYEPTGNVQQSMVTISADQYSYLNHGISTRSIYNYIPNPNPPYGNIQLSGSYCMPQGNGSVQPYAIGQKGNTQANIMTVGATSSIYSVKADGGQGIADVRWDSYPTRAAIFGGDAKNNGAGHAGPNGGANVFVTPLAGADWDVSYDARGVLVPQPLNPTGAPSQDYYYVSGGGSSFGGRGSTLNYQTGEAPFPHDGGTYFDRPDGANIITGNVAAISNFGGSPDYANTSFSVYPAGASQYTTGSSYGSTVSSRGLRGGGGQAYAYGPGTIGSDGIIIVYYPTQYMSFTP